MVEYHNNYDALHFKDRTIKPIKFHPLKFQILVSQSIKI